MYQIKVNGTRDFSVSEDSLGELDAIETTANHFHILEKNKSSEALIQKSNFNSKSYQVKVNNNTYDVVISDALDQQIAAMGFSIGGSKQINNVKAPMPGLILELNITEGQEVFEDDPLLILEAMKMENVITSPRDGIIKSIHVKQGTTVDKNTLLIDFE